jgi:hypothetical protein
MEQPEFTIKGMLELIENIEKDQTPLDDDQFQRIVLVGLIGCLRLLKEISENGH